VSTGLIEVVDELELPPSKQGIVDAVASVLTYPAVQRLIIDAASGSLQVRWFRLPSQMMSLAVPKPDVEELLKSVYLEENAFSGDPCTRLLQSMHYSVERNYVPLAVVVSSKTTCENLFSLSIGAPNTRTADGQDTVAGLPVLYSDQIDEQSFILLGAATRTRHLGNATYGLRVVTW